MHTLHKAPAARDQADNHVFVLIHGGKSLAAVAPDARWPGMFRIHWPDGAISDLTNLTRAKDAAVAIAERGPPRRNADDLRWRSEKTRQPQGSPPVSFPADRHPTMRG
jgi:hypothetical protein